MTLTVVPPSATRRFYRLRYRDADKVQHWRSTKTTSYEAAVRAAERWEREIEAVGTSTPERLTWADFRKRFTEEALPGLADNTRLSYESSMNTLERLCKPRLLADVTESMLSSYAARLRPGRSETTIKSRLTNLSAVIGWAFRTKLIPRMPAFPRIKRTKSRMTYAKGRALTDDEFQKMLAAVPEVTGKRAAASWQRWLAGLWWSGLRLEESIKLSWDSGGFRIDASGEYPMFAIREDSQKSGKPQLCAMAPEFWQFLQETPEKKRTGLVFVLEPIEKKKTGRPRTGRHDNTLWRIGRTCSHIGQAAGIVVSDEGKHASAHDLRRSFGTRWAMRVLPQVLKELMRHADINTTMKYYAGLDANRTAEAAWKAILPQSGPSNFGFTCGFTSPSSTVKHESKRS